MSKASKHPGPREDIRRWNNEGGAPDPDSISPGSLPSRARRRVMLCYFNVRTSSGVIEDPEGSTHPDLEAARRPAILP